MKQVLAIDSVCYRHNVAVQYTQFIQSARVSFMYKLEGSRNQNRFRNCQTREQLRLEIYRFLCMHLNVHLIEPV